MGPVRRRRNLLRKRRRRMIFNGICLLLVVGGLLVFAWHMRSFVGIGEAANKANTAQQAKQAKEAAEKAAAQAKAAAIAAENKEEQTRLDQLQQDLSQYIEQYSGKYGICFYDLSNGKDFGINAEDEFTAASTIKVPLNLYLYKKIEAGSVDPNKILTYTRGDYEGGTGVLQYKKVGTSHSIEELSRLSIEYSDNVATNILLRYLGRKNLKDYMRQIGGQVVEDNKNVSCPKDMALYLKLVYEFNQSGNQNGQKLMHNLLNTVFNDRIPALLPKDVKVAHKIGNQTRVINDVGIVFADRTYIIAIMSDNVNETQAIKVLAQISKMTYDAVGKKSPAASQ
jgi:beta-lactamase class A